ncbi:MAG: hypothetical protein V1878_02035 [bacterium]
MILLSEIIVNDGDQWPMITGFNTDVGYNKKVYHVQTEDVAGDNPYVLTLLYQGGAIIARVKTNYGPLSPQKLSERQILELMERQHKKMILDLRSGKFAAVTGVEPERTFAADILSSEKTFDQLILDYLAGQDPSSEKK